MAGVDVLGTLFDHYRVYPEITLEEVSKWKRDYLDTFDRFAQQFEDLEGKTYYQNRREVIVATFDRLHNVMKEIIQDADDIEE